MSKRIRAEKLKRLIKRAPFKTRIYNQCARCGRRSAFIRAFGVCRICLRDLAHAGLLPGVTKSSR